MVIYGAIAVGQTIISLIKGRKSGQQRLKATEIVNDLEVQLQRNLESYLSGPRTRSSQQAHLANFDLAWDWLKSGDGCGNAALGDPGRACISDRAPGGQWDWASYYRDPIANDPNVTEAADTGVGQSAAGQQLMTTLRSNPVLLIGAVALVSFALLSGKE